MRYNDSTLIRELYRFVDEHGIDKFIKFPHLDVGTLHLTELIETYFHCNKIEAIAVFGDSGAIRVSASDYAINLLGDIDDFVDIIVIDRFDDLVLFRSKSMYRMYLKHFNSSNDIKAVRYEVKEDEMNELVDQTIKKLIERTEQDLEDMRLKLKRLKGESQ